jgi:hypothetical protein
MFDKQRADFFLEELNPGCVGEGWHGKGLWSEKDERRKAEQHLELTCGKVSAEPFGWQQTVGRQE